MWAHDWMWVRLKREVIRGTANIKRREKSYWARIAVESNQTRDLPEETMAEDVPVPMLHGHMHVHGRDLLRWGGSQSRSRAARLLDGLGHGAGSVGKVLTRRG